VPPDQERSLVAERRACSLGDPMGCNNLGVTFRGEDAGVPRDDVEALRAFQAGCPEDGGASDDGACGMLGVLLSEGRVIARDPARAVPLLRRGCDGAHDEESCAWLEKALRRR
jgi:TPR repeat protein